MSSVASTRPASLLEAFNFNLTLDDGTNSGFSRISALGVNIAVDSYHEGGATLPVKDPVMVAYENITLETGASIDSTFYDWVSNILETINGAGSGLPIDIDKRNATLYCFNRDKTVAKRIHIYGAFPIQYVGGEWDNSEDRVLIEKLTLAFDYFTITNS